MELFTKGMSLLSTAIIAGGSIYLAFGLIALGTGLKNHQGPEIRDGIFQVIGGVVIIVVGGWLATIQIAV